MLQSLIIFLAFVPTIAYCADICSRIAVINYQEILVDVNNSQKGEGLRPYLERDTVARYYLDEYQKGTKIEWQNAIAGTLSVGLILGGFTSNDEKSKKSLIMGGATLMIINFLIAKTLETANERNLLRAVDEYNKRNAPQIQFRDDTERESPSSNSLSFMVQKSWFF